MSLRLCLIEDEVNRDCIFEVVITRALSLKKRSLNPPNGFTVASKETTAVGFQMLRKLGCGNALLAQNVGGKLEVGRRLARTEKLKAHQASNRRFTKRNCFFWSYQQ